jgi:hypothetical protein
MHSRAAGYRNSRSRTVGALLPGRAGSLSASANSLARAHGNLQRDARPRGSSRGRRAGAKLRSGRNRQRCAKWVRRSASGARRDRPETARDAGNSPSGSAPNASQHRSAHELHGLGGRAAADVLARLAGDFAVDGA